MTISAFHSGVNILNQAQTMSASGARDIQQATLAPPQATSLSPSSPASVMTSPNETITKASTDLLQANTYSQAGANVITRSNQATGSLLNIKV